MGQSDTELCELVHTAVSLDGTAMLLRHDVIADRQPKAGALAGRLRRKEWLEQLVPDFGRDADAVIPNADLDRLAEIAGLADAEADAGCEGERDNWLSRC
jgi:hypothetical protein